MWWFDRSDRVVVTLLLLVAGGLGLWAGWAVHVRHPGWPSWLLAALGPSAGVAAFVALVSVLVELSFDQRAMRAFLAGFGTLEGDQLVLRKTMPEDAGAVVAMMDDVMLEANGLLPRARSDFAAAIALPKLSRMLNMVTIVDRHTGEPAGMATFQSDPTAPGAVQCSLFLAPAHRGKGLAAIAVQGLAHIAADRGADELWFGTRETNRAMRRALERAGADLAELRQHTLPNGETAPSVWYRIVAGNPPVG